jgi:iron complex outermembrane receptor protein
MPATRAWLMVGAVLSAVALAPSQAEQSNAERSQTEQPQVTHTRVASAADASSSDIAGRLEEIVVTARKREENLQTVPVAITAITADDLREKSIIRPMDLKNYTPGLEIRTSGLQRNNVQYFIRGQGETFGSSAAVVTYFSEAPVQNVSKDVTIGNNGQFFDISSVQVLKGPQGTLFGRSTTGGAVLITPQHPTNDFEGSVDVSRGNYAYGEYTGVLNVPIIDGKLSARLAVSDLVRGGFTQSLTTGQELDNWNRQSYRLGVSVTPTDRVDSYFLFQDNRANENNSGNVLLYFNAAGAAQASPTNLFNTTPGVGGGWFAVALPPGLSPLAPAGGLCYALNPGNPAATQSCITQRLGILNNLRNGLNAELARVQNGGTDALRFNQTGAPLILQGRNEQALNITSVKLGKLSFLGDVVAKNIFSSLKEFGAVSRYDNGASADGLGHGLVYNNYGIVNSVPQVTDESNGHNSWLDNFSEEFQLLGSSSRNTWILGYYLERNTLPVTAPPLFASFGNAFSTSPLLTPAVVTDFSLDRLEMQKGIFGQFTQDLSPWVLEGLKFTAGYRWSWSHERFTNHIPVTTLEGNLVSGPADAVQPPAADSQAPSLNVSFDYQVTPDILAYIAHRRGFKPGGSNVSPQTPVPGYQSTYAPETVKDLEIGLKADWLLGGRPLRTDAAIYKEWYSNIQRSTTLEQGNGVPFTEVIDVAKAQIEGFELSSLFEVSRNWELTFNYSYIDAYYTSWPGTTINDITGAIEPLINSPYSGTPRHQGSLGIRYSLPLASSLGNLSALVQYYRQGDEQLNDTALQDNGIGLVKGYGDLNLRLDWNNVAGEPLDVSFFMRNVTNEIHAESIGSFSPMASALPARCTTSHVCGVWSCAIGLVGRSDHPRTGCHDEIGRFVEAPPDRARRLNVTHGCVTHVDFAASRAGTKRPAFGFGGPKPVVPGFFLGGAGIHPGGGVSGLPGTIAARRVERYLKKSR